MKKKATARPAKATSRQSTLNFPTSSEADLVAESTAAETSTKSGAKSRRKRTADDADKHNKSHCDSSAPSAVETNGTQIPDGWCWTTFKDATVNFDGQRVPIKKEDREGRSGEYPYYGASGVIDDIDDYLFDGEFLLVAEDGANLLSRSTPIAFRASGKFWVNNHAHVVQPANGVALRFIEYYLNSIDLKFFVSGSAQPKLNQANLNKIPIPLPSLPEQHRIVAEIEKQFTRLDAGVAALKRVQANLKRYRAAVLKAACEGRLVPTEAELWKDEGRRMKDEKKRAKPSDSTSSFIPHTSSFESGEALLARILAERRKNWEGRGQYKEPVAPDTATLASLPDRWAWATVEQLTSLVATGATPYRGKPDYWKGGTIPWVTSGALNDTAVRLAKEFITPLAIEETNAKLFPPGTLLVALYGEGRTRGMVSELRIEAATNQACAALLFSDYNSELKAFVRVFLLKNYNDVRLLSSGGVQPNLSLSIVKQTKIPLPPLAEQTRIVAEVERRLSVVEELEAVVSANLQRATRLRQSILQKAFTGNLV